MLFVFVVSVISRPNLGWESLPIYKLWMGELKSACFTESQISIFLPDEQV